MKAGILAWPDSFYLGPWHLISLGRVGTEANLPLPALNVECRVVFGRIEGMSRDETLVEESFDVIDG